MVPGRISFVKFLLNARNYYYRRPRDSPLAVTGALLLFRRPVEELSVHWKRNGVRLTSGLHSYGRRLTIINPTSADTGLYVCEATLRGGAFEPARAKAFLSIIGNAQTGSGAGRDLG